MREEINVSYYPYSVGWAITNQCNLNCKHCNMSSGKKLKDELTLDECCNVIDLLSNEGVQKIMFSGGEPLTRQDFFDIVDYAISKGIFVSITTNSLLLTQKMVEEQFYKFYTEIIKSIEILKKQLITITLDKVMYRMGFPKNYKRLLKV